MKNEQKAELKHLFRVFAGFCAEEGPTNYLNAIFEKVVEGEFPEDLVTEAWDWIKEWEKDEEEI